MRHLSSKQVEVGSNPTRGATLVLNINMLKPKIAIFLHHPQCSVQSAHGIIRALNYDYTVDVIGQDRLRERRLSSYDLLAFPGGIGDSDSWYKLLQPYQDVVKNYQDHGGRYLGICMGAYWAGSHYFDLLRNIEPVQYIKRPSAVTVRSYGTVVPVTWRNQVEHMYFYDGCALINHGARATVIGTYSNGDAAALIQGRVGVIGPHPESDQYWYNKKTMLPYWHQYRHHELLKNFVDLLIQR
jgi:glutamine amidotransferase-like uncharacterized protein